LPIDQVKTWGQIILAEIPEMRSFSPVVLNNLINRAVLQMKMPQRGPPKVDDVIAALQLRRDEMRRRQKANEIKQRAVPYIAQLDASPDMTDAEARAIIRSSIDEPDAVSDLILEHWLAGHPNFRMADGAAQVWQPYKGAK